MATIVIRGKKQVLRNLNRKIAQIEGLSRAGLLKAALMILRESKKQVPVMTGHLRSTGYVDPDIKRNGMRVYIGYHAVYAAKTHENIRAGGTYGTSPSGRKYKRWAKVGNYKFLEFPLITNARRVLKIIKANVRIKK